MHFFKLTHVPCAIDDLPDLQPDLDTKDIDFCLLLPELNDKGFLVEHWSSYYYIINSCWMEFNNGTFIYNLAPGFVSS